MQDTNKVRNIALIGHGNCGKTSLAEAMLFTAGKINRLGKVDEGSSALDYEDEEINRNISINSSFHNYSWNKHQVYLTDTPGDDNFINETLFAASAILEKSNYNVTMALNGSSGMEFLKAGRDRLLSSTVIMMSAYGSIDMAIDAMKLGAYDFISKPFKNEEIRLTIKKAEERERLKKENVFCVVLGGGHDMAYGHYKGLKQYLGSESVLGIINFDAHFDLRSNQNGNNSGTPFYQIGVECRTKKIGINPLQNHHLHSKKSLEKCHTKHISR